MWWVANVEDGLVQISSDNGDEAMTLLAHWVHLSWNDLQDAKGFTAHLV